MLNRIYKIKNLLLLAALTIVLLTACGSEVDYVNTPMTETNVRALKNNKEIDTNFLQVSSSDYDLLTPNFYYSSDNEKFWSIQANLAEDLYDHDALNVVRIDIPKENGLMPTSLDKIFSIGGSLEFEEFPGEILIFNGKESTYNRVEEGVISFIESDEETGYVGGLFQVILTDYDSFESPAPQHHLTGLFGFQMGTHSSVNTRPEDMSDDYEETESGVEVSANTVFMES